MIEIGLGNGGNEFKEFYEKSILKHFNNSYLSQKGDGAILPPLSAPPVLSTDSFVATPRIFNGGSLGKLAFCGTVNDLSMMGARPLYLTLNLIIEEGFDSKELDFHLGEIARLSRDYTIPVVTGDTKVVPRGSVDGLFMATTGLGQREIELSPENIKEGDLILINGTLGDHAMTLFSHREDLDFKTDLKSDCTALHEITLGLCKKVPGIKFLRDATRGGVSAVLNELADQYSLDLGIYEERLSLHPAVSSACELFGMDPLELANEGKFICVLEKESKDDALKYLSSIEGQKPNIIGEVQGNTPLVTLITSLGGKRIIDYPRGEQLPRIC